MDHKAVATLMSTGHLSRRLLEFLQVIFTFAVLGVLVFPFLWIFLNSIRPTAEIISDELRFIPQTVTFENYQQLVDSNFPLFIFNSFAVSLPAMVLSVLVSFIAAYSFARRNFRFRYALLILVVFSQLFPFIILTTPVFLIFSSFGLVNTRLGLIITYTAISIPFAVYMLMGYINSVPRELDEATVIDGGSIWTVLFRVILPVAWPGVAATAIFSFARAWTDFLFALTLNVSNDLWTIPVGLANFFGQYTTDWGLVMTASVFATLPTLIVFFILQRQIISGLALGAIK